MNFYNSIDWALGPGVWEFNQYLKPDSGYVYSTATNTFYEENKSGEIPPAIALNPNDQNDRYKIYAYVDPAHSIPLGRAAGIGAPFASTLNMNTVLGFGNRHWQHSAEFESTNIDVGAYWAQLLASFGLRGP